MKKFLPLISILLSVNCFSQNIEDEPFTVYNVRNEEDGSCIIYANNNYFCDESVLITFNMLKNMKADVELPFKGVVPPKVKAFKLLTLTIKDPTKESQLGYITKYCHGDIYDTNKKEEHIYLLPYQQGEQHPVGQGYGGKFSHYMKGLAYAIDFNMDEGTPVCAARGGVVIAIKDDSDKHGKTIDFQEYGNYITIYHEDGSFSNYFHIQKNGSKVKVGDKVNAGDIIALSGNTGWSSGPHLHFQVFVYTNDMEVKTIPVKFLQEGGKAITVEKSKIGYVAVH